jgi:hypothetical protein
MWLREKMLKIFRSKKDTVRATAENAGLPKSTVFHHQKRAEERNQYEESSFWETDIGYRFLIRLVVASIYTFSIKGGLGAGRIKEFFELIRIGTHVGISDSSILLIIKEIEELILDYKKAKELKIKSKVKDIKLILGVDETWFDKMYLVCQELSSGYILFEEVSKDRSAETWHEHIKKTE